MSREMVNSGVDWLGEIPTHWELRRARFMFRQSTSKGNDRLVLLSATQDRGVVDKSTLDSVVQVAADADLSLFKTVHKNDFVISLRSFQGGFEISHEEGVISPAYTVFRLSNQDYPHYYRYLFKSYGFIDKINSLTVGIREGKNIQYVDFSNMLLPFFPLAEQQKIAEFLDRKCAEVDEMIALQGQIIEELKAYKQSVITEAVTKGLNPAAPMRDSGIEWIGSIPEHWEVMPHKRVMHKIKEIQEVYNGEKILSLTMRGVIVRDLDGGGKMPTTFDGYQKVYPNNLLQCLFDIDVTPRCVGLIKDEGLTSPAYSQFELFANGYAPYYDYLLRYMDDIKAMLHLSKNLRSSLTETDFGAIPTCVPPITEQQAIADYLDEKCADIDSLIQTKQSKIDSLKEYKKSIIYEYVTGKREVNE